MKIEIFARVIYVAPEVSNNELEIKKNNDGDIIVKYTVYDPTGAERIVYREKFPEEFLVPGTMYALVEFWDGYTIIEHRPGTYDGIFGAHSMTHKATFAVATNKFIVFTNTPIRDGNNVTFVGGSERFWAAVKKSDVAFAKFEARARTKSEIAAQLDPHASIAALEAQVDILCKIVLATFGPGAADANALKDAIGDTSLLTLKSDAEVLADIRKRKALVREKQARRAATLASTDAATSTAEAAAAAAENKAAEAAAAQATADSLNAEAAALRAQAEAFRQIVAS